MRLSTATTLAQLTCVILILSTIVSCAATRKGQVGVSAEYTTPIGTFGGSSGVNWDFSGPSDEWCGCITFLDENGEAMDAPKGSVQDGAGGGVVPKGAVGWSIELTDEGCDDLDCNPKPEPPPVPPAPAPAPAGTATSTSTRTFIFINQLWEHTPWHSTTPGASLTEYIIQIEAKDSVRANRKLLKVLNERDTTFLPDGVEIFHLLQLEVVNSPTHGFLGLDGFLVNSEPMDWGVVEGNGHPSSIHLGQAPMTGQGYFQYGVTIPSNHLNFDPTFDTDFSNTITVRTGEFGITYEQVTTTEFDNFWN